jgi:hypothetical protein
LLFVLRCLFYIIIILFVSFLPFCSLFTFRSHVSWNHDARHDDLLCGQHLRLDQLQQHVEGGLMLGSLCGQARRRHRRKTGEECRLDTRCVRDFFFVCVHVRK